MKVSLGAVLNHLVPEVEGIRGLCYLAKRRPTKLASVVQPRAALAECDLFTDPFHLESGYKTEVRLKAVSLEGSTPVGREVRREVVRACRDTTSNGCPSLVSILP